MPQILLVVLILIAKLAAEGMKESKKYSKGSYRSTSKYDLKLRKEQAQKNNYVSDRPTLDQTIRSQSNKQDHFENYDTDDYESFTKDECYEENGHFVESQMASYNSYDMRANKIKFMIFALVYCMWEDDDEITRKEKRMFRTISRVVSMNLNTEDTDEVKSFIDNRIDLDDVVSKQRQYRLDINDIVDTMSSLRNHLKKDKRYQRPLKVIENRFKFEL